MTEMHVESICDLSMVSAEYRQIESGAGSPCWGYQITVSRDGAAIARFEVEQEAADQLADQLGTLAALIRAHTRHRLADQF